MLWTVDEQWHDVLPPIEKEKPKPFLPDADQDKFEKNKLIL
jgi:hypothetical protein